MVQLHLLELRLPQLKSRIWAECRVRQSQFIRQVNLILLNKLLVIYSSFDSLQPTKHSQRRLNDHVI